jgi:hypothetical protein
VIGIRQGVVVGRKILDNRQDPPANTGEHAVRLRAAMPIGLIRFADEDTAEPVRMLRCEIAGTGHHCDDTTCSHLAKQPVLVLVREPDNPHDANAIAVHLDNRRVGYIPRRYNTVLARLLDAGKCLRARVEEVTNSEAAPWVEVQVVVEMEA